MAGGHTWGARKRTWGADQHYHPGVSCSPDRMLTVSLWDVVTSRKQDIYKVYDTMCLFHWIASLIKVPTSQGFPGSSSSKTLLPAPSAGVQVPEMVFHMLQLRPGPVK